jgi:Fe-S-cluster containining protein
MIYNLGKRKDVVGTKVVIDQVVFHIPMLMDDGLFILWKCIWPDCHYCCDRQGRLPLTKDDIKIITRKMGYRLESEFIRTQVGVSSWEETTPANNVITTITMLSLKRSSDENPDQDGAPIRCRFLDKLGHCGLHPEKPGVCWLYPFASWVEIEKGQNRGPCNFSIHGRLSRLLF